MKVTVKQFLDGIQFINGVNGDSCAALAYLNRARETLYPMDDWEGTIEYGIVPSKSGAFFLPWHIETIRAAWTCCAAVELHNEYWNVVDGDSTWGLRGDRIFNVYSTGLTQVLPVRLPFGQIIGYRITDTKDSGISITTTLKNPRGTQDSETVALTGIVSPVYGELSIAQLKAISKPPTYGAVEIWTKDTCNRECLLYILESQEQNPLYRQYCGGSCCGDLVIRGKLKFVEYTEKDYNNYLDIASPQGVRFAIRAIQAERTNSLAEYGEQLKVARTHLERAKEDIQPGKHGSVASRWNPHITVSPLRYDQCR